jgi:hypothetical protein
MQILSLNKIVSLAQFSVFERVIDIVTQKTVELHASWRIDSSDPVTIF